MCKIISLQKRVRYQNSDESKLKFPSIYFGGWIADEMHYVNMHCVDSKYIYKVYRKNVVCIQNNKVFCCFQVAHAVPWQRLACSLEELSSGEQNGQQVVCPFQEGLSRWRPSLGSQKRFSSAQVGAE